MGDTSPDKSERQALARQFEHLANEFAEARRLTLSKQTFAIIDQFLDRANNLVETAMSNEWMKVGPFNATWEAAREKAFCDGIMRFGREPDIYAYYHGFDLLVGFVRPQLTFQIDDGIVYRLESSSKTWTTFFQRRRTSKWSLKPGILVELGLMIGFEIYLTASHECSDFLTSDLREEQGPQQPDEWTTKLARDHTFERLGYFSTGAKVIAGLIQCDEPTTPRVDQKVKPLSDSQKRNDWLLQLRGLENEANYTHDELVALLTKESISTGWVTLEASSIADALRESYKRQYEKAWPFDGRGKKGKRGIKDN